MATLLQRQFANRAYWEKRERLAREEYMRSEEEQLAEIDMIYRDMYRWCEDEINRFYGKYADAEGISINEAKKRVAKEDVEAFKDLAKQYVKDKDFSDKANAELRLYNATMKINRLEMLKARIGLKLVDSTNEIEKYMGEKLTERAMAEFTRQAGILGSTVDRTETAARAKQIVNASFKNATFSERLWSHASNLRDEIGIQLQRGLISGAGSRKMAQDIKDKFGGNLNDAHRLMVTELRRVQTDVAMESYKAQGITQYEYMAVNPSACSVCKDINGKIYEVKKGEVGLNLPPMHPRCHCTTAPHINNASYEAWLNWLDNGGTTAEWDALDPQEKARLINNAQQQTTETKPQEPSAATDTTGFTRLKSADITDTYYRPLIEKLESMGVGYKQVVKLKKTETESERIKAISGGDMTKGSCASLGLCYIGRKIGLDVLDFRGGDSQDFFCKGLNLIGISKAKGIKRLTAQGKSSITVGYRLLKQCEEGKEYYLVCGRHAAIVRKHDDTLQYLELQSSDRSGWTDFNGNPRYTLNTRFGATSASGYIAEEANFMIDLQESNFDTDEFRTLLGYLNTSESEQRKGTGGTIK